MAVFCEQTISCLFLVIQLFSVVLCISVELQFEEFIEKYDKHYEKQEYAYRLQIFKNTLKRIQILNKRHTDDGHLPYGVTKFADMTREEFLSKVLKRDPGNSIRTKSKDKIKSRLKRAIPVTNTNAIFSRLPQRVDWRDSNVINPVRNQGECGACWAFSTVETLESMYAIGSKELVTLSVQQVIDCANNGNYGCQGGDTCTALAWMNNTKAEIVLDSTYPFKHATGSCKMKNNSVTTKGVQIRRFTCDDFSMNEGKMLDLLANHGPLVVAVDATMWQDYLGGIIKFHCETMHNHAVQIVGYELSGPVPYYIVRNSWGREFGLDGYLYVAIGKNLCGIANEVSTVDAVY